MEDKLLNFIPDIESLILRMPIIFITKFKKIKIRHILLTYSITHIIHEKLIRAIQLQQIQMHVQRPENKLFPFVINVSLHNIKELLLINSINSS